MATTDAKRSHDDLRASPADLLTAGWERASVTDDRRLEELIETYEEIGFEVKLLPVPLDDAACTECMRQDPDRFRVIYIRRRQRETDGEDGI